MMKIGQRIPPGPPLSPHSCAHRVPLYDHIIAVSTFESEAPRSCNAR
jgi:hypothetical protein